MANQMVEDAEKRGGYIVNPDGSKATAKDVFKRASDYLFSEEKDLTIKLANEIFKQRGVI